MSAEPGSPGPGPSHDGAASDRAIRALVERNPKQCSVAEYTLVRNVIREQAPANVLVFGVGRDTRLWMATNEGGRTVFLENFRKWIQHTRSQAPGAEVVRVSYHTRRFMWAWLLRRPRWLRMRLPAEVRDTDWDVIFVDAPKGHRWRTPGRMQSVYTAAALASRSGDTDVFVHDCDRPVERTYCDVYLGHAELVAEVDRLRHYRVE